MKKMSKYLMYLSAAVLLTVSSLMIINFVQIKTHPTVAGDTVDQLVKRLNATPDDEALRDQIRAVDLLARKAYFSSVWQLETGAWLLLGFGILFLASLRIYTKKESIDTVLNERKDPFWTARAKERKALLIAIGSLATVALLVSFGSRGFFTDFTAYQASPGPRSAMEIKDTVLAAEPVDSLQSDSVAVPVIPTDAEIKRNHPGFRGPFGLGVSYRKNLPTDWDGATGKNVVWKKALPLPGLNSPVLWGDHLFLAGANASVRKVFCYNRLNGSLEWAKEVRKGTSGSPKVSNDAGYSASSLTTDGQRVFAIFATGDLVCLDLKGEEVWAKNLGLPDNHYGYSSSLLLYKDKLIVQYDDAKSCKLLALNTLTGAEVWNTKRDGQISWSSPILTPKGEIIVSNLPYVAAFNAETGKLKWKTDCLSGEIGSSPAYGNGMTFAANEYAKMVGIRDGKMVWEAFEYLPDVSSPVAYKDFVFFTTSYGDMVCIQQKDGTVLWHHEFENGFYGSPLVADGKLYNTDRAGVTAVVEAGREFKLIAQSALGEKSDCTPAFADGRIYIRGYKNLYCIGKK